MNRYKYLCAIMYVAAGISTATAIKEVHYHVCTPWPNLVYAAIAAIWPVAGVLMVTTGHAPSFCGAAQ